MMSPLYAMLFVWRRDEERLFYCYNFVLDFDFGDFFDFFYLFIIPICARKAWIRGNA
jgi:hypothetical protein